MKHPDLPEHVLDRIVATKPLQEILHDAANFDTSTIDPTRSNCSYNEDIFRVLTAPTEIARHAIGKLTDEPDEETRSLLMQVARKNGVLREVVLAKLGQLHLIDDDPLWPMCEDLSP